MKRSRKTVLSVTPTLPRPLTPERLGKKGEEFFAFIAPDNALVANRSADADTMGWDYFVEFPYVSSEEVSLDKRPHPIECKVQIKTIWDDGNTVTLTLSAAERLARSKLPTFIIVIKMGRELRPTSMHGIHMIDDNLSKVLKGLRQASARNSLNINKQHVSFSAINAAKIDLNGLAVSRYIEDCVGGNIDTYIKNKLDQINNLGFPERRYSLSFSLQEKDERAVNQIFLGLRDADVTSFKTEEIRFDIRLPIASDHNAIVKITPQAAGKCKIILRNKRYIVPIRIEADIFIPPYRTKTLTYRVSNELIDILVTGDELEITNKLDKTTKVSIEAMLTILKLQEIFSGEEAHMEIALGGKKVLSGSLDLTLHDERRKVLREQIKIASALRKIIEEASIRNLEVTFPNVMENHNEILLLHDLITDEKNVRVSDLIILPQPGKILEPKYDGIFIRKIDLGNISIGYYFAITASMESKDEGVLVSISDLSLRDISEIDQGAASYEAYCEDAKAIMGLEFVMAMRYEDGTSFQSARNIKRFE